MAANEEDISGIQKAAILLISLGPEKSASIFKHLKEDEIESLTLEIANTRSVPPDLKGNGTGGILRSVSCPAVYFRGRYRICKRFA